MPIERPTAAVLLIGDELLSGKIRDANGWFLAQRLRARGIELVEIATVPDDLERIGSALFRLLGRAPLVFTSGGVGPTHDDKTMEAIAAATGRPLERHAELARTLEEYYGDRITEAALTMADIPRGTVPVALPGWPVLRLELEPTDGRAGGRVYILPGVPPLLRAKIQTLESIEGELPVGPPWALVTLHVETDESALAPDLDAVVAAHPEVSIGSYPRWTKDDAGERRVTVVVTFDAADAEAAQGARARLTARLDPAAILEAVAADPEAPGLAG